jgi:4-oxalocrotonate tautomerase
MAILTVDLRGGRTDEQKRAFAAAVLDVVCEATGEPRENILLILQENPGINFVENAAHLPELGDTSAKP